MSSRARAHGSVTIADVARAAEVSRATASRALNDSSQVTEQTKRKVRDAARSVGFVMNARGRQLATGRSEAIAILVTEPLDELFVDPTYATVLRGINEGLARTPTLPLLLQAWSPEERQRALQHFERRSVDAVINISPYVGGDLLDALANGPLPVTLCGQLEGNPYEGVFSSVWADDVAGSRLAAEHMVARKRRTIAIINGPLQNPAAADRLRGYREALGERYDEDLTVSTGWDTASGIAAMRELLERRADIDGVLAASDRLAVGAITALGIAGRRVPRDVSVIGFDDHALAAQADPPLTTVRQPLIEQGKLAAELTLGMIAGKPPKTVVLPMSLTERVSA
ncbi:LacI family DNA-binding transcriptional regulator [Tessaracoccus caeni]|uniref:LacI family DNA-binding transcriptional regulator n=1 Tax=Tessaracoccus caeni TaxID=3031239 RepID=UPI0023DBF3EA|nr:LacI family DNA-binding transcriptional regulator [Tessaracoccus caeni]MDF1486807.1 LacI family DNA-binding transcriptional regulator [Tessaracoccus caeni]